MKLADLEHKKILILGYGKEGKVTKEYLRVHFPDKEIGIADRTDGADYLSRQSEYDLIIKSPGVPKKYLTKPYTTATNIFFANVTNTIVGVTGSKGKSTTSSLVYHILKELGRNVRLAGNIGNPMLSELLKPVSPNDIFVLELSSYQLEDIEYSPHISVILNLFPEHMDYHGNVETYYQAKKKIIDHAQKKDFFVFNPKYEKLVAWSKETLAEPVPFPEKIPVSIGETHLLGDHNFENMRAAVAVARLLGVDENSLRTSLQSFQPLRHRLQKIGTFNDITFYDDAISTTPESTIAAIKALKNIGTIFVGGQDRGYDFTLLADEITKAKIQTIVAFPDSGPKIVAEIKRRVDYSPLILETKSMNEAVEFAYKHSPPSTICLLSTASPSYTLWKNFEEKGDQFQLMVTDYEKTRKK